ncbi:MAG: N-acyl homoserine lactonase family protein [Pseudomonadota bacterium]
MSRRRLLTLSGTGTVLAAATACAQTAQRSAAELPNAPSSPAPVTARVGRRMRLHMFQTGWVAVKAEHRAFSGLSGMRFPAIMASRNWTEWLPVTAYVIEHPDGLFLVDTGETARMLEPEYSACDPMTGLFYRRNLRFSLSPTDELGPQMRRFGLDPDRVQKVIMTHLHSDHMGGMRHFPRAEFLVSKHARSGHTGALICRIPTGLNLLGISVRSGQAGVFKDSYAVTADGSIAILPTSGHAKGHQSVLLRDEGTSVCIVGDAAFNLNQIMFGEIGGIVESVPDARASSELLKLQHQTFGTEMLPTHDPDNRERLQQL